jgi:hypothetical protein
MLDACVDCAAKRALERTFVASQFIMAGGSYPSLWASATWKLQTCSHLRDWLDIWMDVWACGMATSLGQRLWRGPVRDVSRKNFTGFTHPTKAILTIKKLITNRIY